MGSGNSRRAPTGSHSVQQGRIWTAQLRVLLATLRTSLPGLAPTSAATIFSLVAGMNVRTAVFRASAASTTILGRMAGAQAGASLVVVLAALSPRQTCRRSPIHAWVVLATWDGTRSSVRACGKQT